MGPIPLFSVARVRQTVRFVQGLTYWALRPRSLPPSLLMRYRSALLHDLSALGRLQEFGIRGRATGEGSPFAMLVVEGVGEVLVVLRVDVPTSARLVSGLPEDLSSASGIYLRLSDPWLLPVGIGDSGSRRLDALSAVLRMRSDVARSLLTGRADWGDVFTIDGLPRG